MRHREAREEFEEQVDKGQRVRPPHHYVDYCQRKMFETFEAVVFWIVIPEGLVVFISLCLLIVSYLQQKLPALQTLLDLVIIDTVRIAIFTEVFTLLPYFVHFTNIRLSSFSAHLCLLAFRFFFTCLCNLIQTALIVRAILLFKSEWFDGLVDQEVLRNIRLGLMGLSSMMFVIDLIPFVEVDNRLNTGLVLMTGEDTR